MEDLKDMQTKLVPGVGRLPYPAYRGNEPYVFISYAHNDQDKVFAEIKRFNEAGFHVWYDEGISPGNEWTDEIADALDGCSLFVVMITPVSAPRKNVLNEINFALDENKPFLAIHLEETEIKGGLKLRIGSNQAILKYNMTEDEYEYKYIEAFTRLGMKQVDVQPVNALETKKAVSREEPVKTALESMLDDYEEIINRAMLDNQAKNEAEKLEESLVKEFHTLGGEGKLDALKAAYDRLEQLACDNPFSTLRLGWVRNRAKSDYAYVLSIKSDLLSKEESVRLFEELVISNPSHTGYADNIRIIKTQIAGYYLKMAEKGDSKAALHAEELYEELAKQNPDRDYQQLIQKAATFVATYRNEKDAGTNGASGTPCESYGEIYDDSPEDAKKRANGDLVRVDGFDIEHGLLRGYFGTERNIKVPLAARIIGTRSFDRCRLFIESVDLNNVKKIIAGGSFGAFHNCPNLKTVKIPKTVDEVTPDMFRYCPNLTVYVRRSQVSADFEERFTGKDIVYLDE